MSRYLTTTLVHDGIRYGLKVNLWYYRPELWVFRPKGEDDDSDTAFFHLSLISMEVGIHSRDESDRRPIPNDAMVLIRKKIKEVYEDWKKERIRHNLPVEIYD